MMSPFVKGILWLLLATSASYSVLLIRGNNASAVNVSDSDLSRNGRVCNSAAMYFPFRVCLDGDSIRSGCIYGLNVHLDNIGTECSLSGVVQKGDYFEGYVVNPTDSERWLVINAPYHANWSVHISDASSPIHQVNHGVIGVLVPPGCQALLTCEFKSERFVELVTVLFIGVFALTLLIISGRSKK
jgi:hypothetical protein